MLIDERNVVSLFTLLWPTTRHLRYVTV